MQKMTVVHYLLRRLEQAGLEHIFGVPGDYVLDFMDRVVESPVHLIGNCNAGYAADAYARLAAEHLAADDARPVQRRV